MARKSRKNMPVAVAEPTDNLTTKAVLSMDKEAKPYQVGIYTRLSFESEANKERDTVDTQIAYIREFINGQPPYYPAPAQSLHTQVHRNNVS